jgi:hypothetical protein
VTYQWATWMLEALRADEVLRPKIIEVPGWQTHGRPPSEFSFFPSGIINHHTACMNRVGHDPQSCINIIRSGHGTTPGPISQLLGTFVRPGTKWDGVNVDPHIVIIAAGRANHAGAGNYNWGAPSGNGSSIGIEWCGPVGRWPDRVIEFYERVDAALLANRGWGVHQLDTHHSYARPVGRKIDVSGARAGEEHLGLTQPQSVSRWRSGVQARLSPPTTSTGDITMIALDHQPGTPTWTALAYTGSQLAHITTGHADAVLRSVGVPRRTITDAALDAFIASSETTTDCPATFTGARRDAWNRQRGATMVGVQALVDAK